MDKGVDISVGIWEGLLAFSVLLKKNSVFVYLSELDCIVVLVILETMKIIPSM